MSLSLDATLGAALIGVIVAANLHGVSCIQAWWYYTTQHDPWPLQLVVAVVLAADTVHQCLITHAVYTYLVTGWGDVLILQSLVWSLLLEVIFSGVTAFIVQSFLVMRIWKLSKRSYFVTLIAMILVLAEFAAITAFTAISMKSKTFLDLARLRHLSITVNVLAAAGDVFIACVLCTLLHYNRTGFQKSDTIIDKLMIFAVNTGMLTSFCALASLVAITVAGNTFIYIAFFFCLSRLYSNSLLATLNARTIIVAPTDVVNSASENLSVALREFPKGVQGNSMRPTNISIKIDTRKDFAMDSDTEIDREKAESETIGIGETDRPYNQPSPAGAEAI